MSSFPQTKTWGGLQCGRIECITCNQGCEELPDCTRASIVYESICVTCNPGAKEKGELSSPAEGAPSLYVGESSRSIQERAMEHWGAARLNAKDSHIAKHQAMEHEGAKADFVFKVVSSHRSSLNRQIREAVRIRRRGGAGNILNSRAEFNRCHIPRLVVEEEDDSSKQERMEKEKTDQEDLDKALEDQDITWVERKARERELAERKRRRNSVNGGDEAPEQGGPKRRKKRMI